jgi:hypothetical protein
MARMSKVLLAGLSPVAAGAEAAGVDRPVGSDAELRHARFQSLGEPEQGALVLAVDLLQVGALDTAVGDVADQQLTGEDALLDQDRCAGGVGDLVLRHP